MNIAYLILAHNTPNHLGRLVDALVHPGAKFFVHIDLKSDVARYHTVAGRPNVVTLSRERVAVFWGQFSLVQAVLNLIYEALSDNADFDYLVLLSGSDYPIQSNERIYEFFTQRKGTEFMNLTRMPEANKPISRLQTYQLQRSFHNRPYDKIVVKVNEAIRKWGVRRNYSKALGSLQPYAGSTWWALTSSACRYVTSFVENNREVVRFFRNTREPDEMFFQTIIGNSPFKGNVARNITFADWSRPTPPYPAIIDMRHLRSFEEQKTIYVSDAYGSGELLFARKFPDNSLKLTQFIEARIRSD